MSANNKGKDSIVCGRFQARHDPEKMRFEVERIKTFKTWSRSCPIRPVPLAKAGFFYVGIFDRVKCFSCEVQIWEWKKDDTAMGRHEQKNSQCEMVISQDKKNITIEKWNEMKECLKQGKEEIDGQVVPSINKTLNLMTSQDYVDAYCGTSFTGKLTRAHVPLLDDELRREDTFRDWPEECKLSRSETKWLANAGFSFTGET